MQPIRLSFLGRFDNFYQAIVNAVKEDNLNEKDFYSVLRAKCKSMDQERRERLSKLSKKAKKG